MIRRLCGHRLWAVAALVAIAIASIGPDGSTATFVGTDDRSQALSTATLGPPTAPAVLPGVCVAGSSDGATVTWAATASTWADGYEVLRATSSNGAYSVAATAAGRLTTVALVGGLSFSTTWWFTIRATKAQWRSVTTSPVPLLTRTSACL